MNIPLSTTGKSYSYTLCRLVPTLLWHFKEQIV